MRFWLKFAYWVLLIIAVISSCPLYCVVASSGVQNVAAVKNEPVDVAATASNGKEAAAAEAQENVLLSVQNLRKFEKLANVKLTNSHASVKRRPPFSTAARWPLRGTPAPTSAAFIVKQRAFNSDSENAAQYATEPALTDSKSEVLVAPSKEKEAVQGEVLGGEVPEVKLEMHLSEGGLGQHNGNVLEEAVDEDRMPKEDGMKDKSLPDITDIPIVTMNEMPLDMLKPTIIIDEASFAKQDQENQTVIVDILENSNEAIQKDEQIIKINDSGGGASASFVETADLFNKIEDNIPADTIPVLIPSATPVPDPITSATHNATGNLTAEEIPMPVFSEWAQKQMEAAEKQQALEQEVVNTSSQKKNNTNNNGKPVPLKIRSKNYAAPDCGAKIISSNADASNTGAVLTMSKDEYMLSPCGNRIWFVVELCEAIQAQKIDLANFELFSSSPKNFTIAVSNRFPTRDWSNVGRFIAQDKRTIQSFELDPHLFGKFVRVDIHSHYSKEHFCPVSLFRVFGTSEFEAFETENHPNMDLDDFDDDLLEQAHAKTNENNLFKSASDAVLSIVKKAAEVLVKPSSNQNETLEVPTDWYKCRTPASGPFSCPGCNQTLVSLVNKALSCEFEQLYSLLGIQRLRTDLLNTNICAKHYGFEEKPAKNECASHLFQNPIEMDVKQSYLLNLLPTDYVGALCQLMSAHFTQGQPLNSQNNTIGKTSSEDDDEAAVALNLTINKKLENADINIIEQHGKQLTTEPSTETGTINPTTLPPLEPEKTDPTSEPSPTEPSQLSRPAVIESAPETVTPVPEIIKELKPDVNIFNIPAVGQPPCIETTTEQPLIEASGGGGAGSSSEDIPHTSAEVVSTTSAPAQAPNILTSTAAPPKSEEDASAWDNLDNLPVNNGNAQQFANGGNSQQKVASSPQSESVFIRLSNRIKTLERNMSLSGQYLEELSRRYKKQVEELQQALTQQSQTVRILEEQNRRHAEVEQLFVERNADLQDEVKDLTLQIQVVIVFVGTLVCLFLVVGTFFYRAMRREQQHLFQLIGSKGKRTSSVKRMNRRKSFDDCADTKDIKCCEKQRRPSEEAMLILKECGEPITAMRANHEEQQAVGGKSQLRQRKISVCYSSSNSNINGENSAGKGRRRNGEKLSWPSAGHHHPWEFVDTDLKQDKAKEAGHHYRAKSSHSTNSGQNIENQKNGKSKKKPQNLKRQGSAPGEFTSLYDQNRLNVTSPAAIGDYDENLMLDEDGLDNFIPNSDLVYNEFMPEGPSGYQIIDDVDGSSGPVQDANKKDKSKKSRRLSSPGFFKSPFTKNLKPKSNPGSKVNTPHESSTSWEWYRLRKSSEYQQQKSLPVSRSAAGGFVSTSPAVSLDSTSLSEINFPTNSMDNSFRILKEAILTSEGNAKKRTPDSAASATTSPTNVKKHAIR